MILFLIGIQRKNNMFHTVNQRDHVGFDQPVETAFKFCGGAFAFHHLVLKLVILFC